MKATNHTHRVFLRDLPSDVYSDMNGEKQNSIEDAEIQSVNARYRHSREANGWSCVCVPLSEEGRSNIKNG